MYKTAAAAVLWLVFGGAPAASAHEASAQDPSAQEPIFSQPDKQLQVNGRLKIPHRTLYLPVTQVKWMIHGKFTARGGGFRSASSSKEVTSDVDEARVRRIAQALHDDLAAQAAAAGWTVRTRRDMGADVPAYKPAAANEETGYPIDQVTSGKLKISYGVFAPDGMPMLMVSGMTSPAGMAGLQGLGAMAGMAAMTGITQESYRFARANPGVTLIVDYGFATAALGETDSRMLGTEVAAALVMTGGVLAYTANSQSVIKIEDGIAVAKGIGALEQISRSGTGSNVMRYLAGLSTVDKTGYVWVPEWDRVEVEAIRAGKAFNSQVLARLER